MKSIHICFHILLIFIGASHQNSETTSLIETVDQGGSNLYDIKDKINNNEVESLKDDSISQNKNLLNNDYNFNIDQKEQDSLNANDASLSGENDKESPSFSDANDAENSLDDDSSVTNDEKKDTDDYYRNDNETNQDTNEEDTDQADDDKSEDDQIDLKKIFTNLENGNEDANADFDEESKKIVVISIVENQSEEQQETDDQEQQQLEQPSDDFSNNQKMENSNNQVEYSETKPLFLFKIRPIQRVFDRVLDTESDYYYKLLEMYEKNALESEKKYYKRIYRRFGAKIENDQNENDMLQNGEEEEETEEEGEEREGELSIDEILYRKKMLDNGENFRNEMMQIIMNKIQRIETLIISSFQLLLVLSIFLIVVQFLILLNNLMKKSKHRVYQHRLITKAANNNQNAYSDNSYGVKSKHDILNV